MSLLSVPDKLENLPKLRDWLAAFRLGILTEGLGGGGGADIYAATRVVDPTGNGTHTTIAAAVASLPAEGGTVFVKGGIYNISVGIVAPANTRIVGAGRNSTIINMIGAITLFTATSGYFCLAEVTINGDDASVQTVFNTNTDVDVACCDFADIYGLVFASSSAAEVTMADCYITLAGSVGTGLYLWKGATGGEFNWNYVEMSVPITLCNLIEGPTPGSAGCNWKTIHSYTGGPPPALVNYYYTQTIDFVHFSVDGAQIVVSGTGNKVTGSNFVDGELIFKNASNLITNSSFFGGGIGGSFLEQLNIEVLTVIKAETIISGCKFDGNSSSWRGVTVDNSDGVIISNCDFSNHTQCGVLLAVGTTPSRSIATVVGCRFVEALSAAVFEGDANSIGTYAANEGFGTSILESPSSTVDAENYRNVRTWGAVGDGTTDDTAAIQAAFDSFPPGSSTPLLTGGGTLFFPPGTYKVTETLTIPDQHVTIKGCGDSSVIDVAGENIAVFTLPGSLTAYRKIDIIDIRITGGGGGVVAPVGGALVGGTLNNTFASAPSITGGNGTFAAGSTVGFTKEAGEPATVAGNAGGKSGWLEWTAPASGTCTIDLSGSTFDTLLGVYTGVSVGALTLVIADDDGGAGTTSLVTFSAVMGTSYKIMVDGFGGASGSVTFTMTLTASGGGSNNSIIDIQYDEVNVEFLRVNSREVVNPFKVTLGGFVNITATDCFFSQVASGGSVLCDNSPSFDTVNLILNNVDYWREYQSTVTGGAFCLGEGLSDFTGVNIIGYNSRFSINVGCSTGAFNLTNCNVYNYTAIAPPTIFIEDDNEASWNSCVDGSRLSFIDFDINGNGTKFNDCYIDTCVFTDNAISYFKGCEFIGTVTAIAVIIGDGETSIIGCTFFSNSNGTSYIINDPIVVSGCIMEDAPVASIHLQSSEAIITGNQIAWNAGSFPYTTPPVLESGAYANNRYTDNKWNVQPTLLSGNSAGNGPAITTNPGGLSSNNGSKMYQRNAFATTSSFISFLNEHNVYGLIATGYIKNVGGSNSLEVRETWIDAFGTTVTVTTTVAAGGTRQLLALDNTVSTAFPPYTDYKVEVRHPTSATTFTHRILVRGVS
jgi:hypothetical protein